MPEDYRPFEFEGRRTPPAEGLRAALPALVRGPERAWIVRAAVVSAPLADAALEAAESMLDGPPDDKSAALIVAHGLLGRRLVAPLADRMTSDGWLGVPDPAAPRSTLAQQALRFVVDAIGPRRARPILERAIAVPELRVLAWGALAGEAPDLVLPHLAALLTEAPGLAPDVATRFALVHTARCHEACRAISGLPEPTRRAFGLALEKHLRRIFAIRRWAECRRILFGR